MKKIEVALEHFKLEQFLKDIISGNEGIVNKPVFAFSNCEDMEVKGDEFEQSPLNEVVTDLMEGNYLYANFSSCEIDGPEIPCADGEAYLLLDEIYAEDYFDDEDEEHKEELPEDFVFRKDLYLGEYSSVGFLLKMENDVLTIQTALYSLAINGFVGPCGIGSQEGVRILEDAEVFDKPMEAYVRKYVK
ncbi:MAG: hypothetical protein ACI35O_14440 [Bacillaceae bacterium]